MSNSIQVFRTLSPGQVVTVPLVYSDLHRPEPLPPIVEILTFPVPCPEGCGAYEVTVTNLETGAEMCIHRRAQRPVVPAQRPTPRSI